MKFMKEMKIIRGVSVFYADDPHKYADSGFASVSSVTSVVKHVFLVFQLHVLHGETAFSLYIYLIQSMLNIINYN